MACPLQAPRVRGVISKTTQPAIEKTFPTDEGTGKDHQRVVNNTPVINRSASVAGPVVIAACDGQQSSILLDAAMWFMVWGPFALSRPSLASPPSTPPAFPKPSRGGALAMMKS
ncbi:hypothetical protein C8A05DRAFT_29072 [Staphylotrichum tortipilum]|uniref:Uncharacterized protein n=1 Tax=Staphylotrichum tortipilum TaxID=2831512 RepID=A0AAN6RY37_9PEZI|nr:hypothetical protein C8A05DRAFT_29072 [Staphylotrichum longicolle]